MSSKKVSQEPAAQSLTGDELVRVVQAGQSKRTTTQAIAALSAVAKAGDTMTGAAIARAEDQSGNGAGSLRIRLHDQSLQWVYSLQNTGQMLHRLPLY